MPQPSIIGAETAYYGETFGALVEACLRERGLTNPNYASTDATYTSATTAQVAQAQTCVKDALVYLQTQRSAWFPLSEEDCTAVSDYTRVNLPLDFSTFGKGGAWIAGVRLKILSTEEYAANVRKDSDGGGLQCCEVSGEPTHARLVMTVYSDSGTNRYRWALDVFPRQTAAWTAHILYVATAKDITSDTTTIRLPVVMHPIMEDLTRANWRKKSGDAKGAAQFLKLAEAALEDVGDLPGGDQTNMRAVSGLPSETATRYG